MARRRLRKFPSNNRFILLPHVMLKSPAWKSLSPNARALLLEVWARHNDNGEISYAVREADAIGMHHSTASRAFDELVEKGLPAHHERLEIPRQDEAGEAVRDHGRRSGRQTCIQGLHALVTNG
jgi:hypothetical protein